MRYAGRKAPITHVNSLVGCIGDLREGHQRAGRRIRANIGDVRVDLDHLLHRGLPAVVESTRSGGPYGHP